MRPYGANGLSRYRAKCSSLFVLPETAAKYRPFPARTARTTKSRSCGAAAGTRGGGLDAEWGDCHFLARQWAKSSTRVVGDRTTV